MSDSKRVKLSHALALLQKYQSGVGLLLLLLVAVFLAPKTAQPGALFGSVFFTSANLRNALNQVAVPGVLAVGATVVIVSGGIDLSAGSALGLLNCVLATWLVHGSNQWISYAYVLAVGLAIGAGLGFLVSVTRLQPFIVTLAAMVTLRGAAFVYTNSANVSALGSGLKWMQQSQLGLPVAGWIFVGVAILVGLVLKTTVLGRRIYAVGGSQQAARYAGVPVSRVKVAAFAINGLCVAVAAILFTSRNTNGQPNAGTGYELDAISAAVVGGAALSGGVGSITGTLVGALFIVGLNILLILQGVSYYVGQGWKGCVILLAVYLQNIGRVTQ